MKKLVSSILILILLSVTVITPAFADTSEPKYLVNAMELKYLGLFNGGSNGFELDRVPTRLESGIMLIRLLGKEKEALEKKYPHPFTDVPEWADSYVGYLYENKLTTGIGNNQFGSTQLIDAKGYTTFVLRALGYNDKNGDFSYSAAIFKAQQVGMLNHDQWLALTTKKSFLRDDMVGISSSALKTKLKGDYKTLGTKLVNEGAVLKDKAISVEIYTLEYEDLTDVNQSVVARIDPSWNDYLVTYINTDKLPGSIKSNFYGIKVSAFDKDMDAKNIVTSELTSRNFLDVEHYNNAIVSTITDQFSAKNYFVFFYDAQGNLIGYHKITQEDLDNSNKYFKNVKVEFTESVDSQISGNYLKIYRKINGVIDEGFRPTNYTLYRQINDDNKFSEVTIKNLAYEVDGVEYFVESTNSSVKIKSVTVQP